MNNNILKGIKAGDVITAKMLNDITNAINANTCAVRAPKQTVSADNANPSPSVAGSGAALGNEVFTAKSLTESTVTSTDSNGDTTPLHVVTQLVCTENTTGRSMTIIIPSALYTA